jgi:outer membrane protein assembly factor BamB
MLADQSPAPKSARGLRLWPAGVIMLLSAMAVRVVKSDAMQAWLLREKPHLTVSILTVAVLAVTALLLLAWWLLLSRARWTWRLAGVAAAGMFLALFRHTGMSGDLMPTFEFRWSRAPSRVPVSVADSGPAPVVGLTDLASFPQFLGPDRNGVLPDARLATNWSAKPPAVLWRRPLGSGWSGFAVVRDRAVTMEQLGAGELITCYSLATGELLWEHGYPSHFASPIAGDGPRATPTVVSDRVFTLGARGALTCLEFASGKPLWSRSLTNDFGARLPEWGFSGSPLVTDGLVIINAGGSSGRALVALRADTGETAWSAGDDGVTYSSPGLFTVAGVRQIVLFQNRAIVAHDPATGRVLWRQPWGTHYPLVAMPVPVDDRRLLFSAGYNVGAELFELRSGPDGSLAPVSVWATKRLKAKFANPYARAGFAYGLDDGILACLDLKDGSQRWKEGRYGHGQGLLVGAIFLLLSEQGELVQLSPTPDGPNELGRFRVFGDKSWNPPALVGDLVLVRNDREAALLRLPTR